MTSKEFVIWLKGFSEGCPEFHPTPKQWDRLKEVLEEVEDDYIEQPGTFQDHSLSTPPYPYQPYISPYHYYPRTINPPGFSNPLTGSISIAGTGGTMVFNTSESRSSAIYTTIWNDKMGCWHYTNYPEGFGYYTNSTLNKVTPEETKKQLID